jgi:hypothetical protein
MREWGGTAMGKRGKETEYEDEFEYEYDWGTIRKWEGRGRSQRAEYIFFEPENCPVDIHFK